MKYFSSVGLVLSDFFADQSLLSFRSSSSKIDSASGGYHETVAGVPLPAGRAAAQRAFRGLFNFIDGVAAGVRESDNLFLRGCACSR
jgi:hypothetical protein